MPPGIKAGIVLGAGIGAIYARLKEGGPVGHLLDGDEVTGLPVDDDVGDASGRGADDGQSERHRPQTWPRAARRM